MKTISPRCPFQGNILLSISPKPGREGSPNRPGAGGRGRLGEASLPGQAASHAAALFRRPELLLFFALLALFNIPVLTGSCWRSMMFQPGAVQSGEWWRLFTHPFVHVTWYHLLLDGAAFLALYHSLIEVSVVRRLLYVLAAGAGSLFFSWATAPGMSTSSLCGLSGIAHGLMAVSALEMVGTQPPGSAERRIGQVGFLLVAGKAALEALSGRMFFTFLHFGLMGDPVAVSHAGGIVGSLTAMLLLNRGRHQRTPFRLRGCIKLTRTASRPGSRSDRRPDAARFRLAHSPSRVDVAIPPDILGP